MAETEARLDVQKETPSHIKGDGEVTNTAIASSWQQNFRERKKIIIPIVLTMVAIVALALGLGLGLGLTRACPTQSDGTHHSPPKGSAPTPTPTPSSFSSNANGEANIFQPAVGTTWDLPLGFSLTAANANKSTIFYPVDLENTPANTISALKTAGHSIVCYFSAGSVESYREDAGEFPAKATGKALDGWPDEKWLDVRDSTVRAIMATRIQSAAAKGCLGIDADNVDGYQNDSGFDLTEDDAVDYVKYLAATAQAAGLAYGLKNAGNIVDRVVDVAQWAINEECAEYEECAAWAPFVKAGKPVFHVEYTDDDNAKSVDSSKLAKACAADGQNGFSSIVKHLSLDNWVVYC
ncbi:glycoside hydrolase family 114 protein [Xylariaceae sp. AK1471]|nr:glycoside hydrolase family 114 protein [Xylariaceae sp. AK1471]